MPTSKHRKSHQKKSAARSQSIQNRREHTKSLFRELEVAMIQAQIDQPAGFLKIMEDQPTTYITGQEPTQK
jgi:hypothetical protein